MWSAKTNISLRLSIRLAYLWMKGEKKNTLGLHTRLLYLSELNWHSDLLFCFYEQFRTNAKEQFPPLDLQNQASNPHAPFPPFNTCWVKEGSGIAPSEGKLDLKLYLDQYLELGSFEHVSDVTLIFKKHTYLEDVALESGQPVVFGKPQASLSPSNQELEIEKGKLFFSILRINVYNLRYTMQFSLHFS